MENLVLVNEGLHYTGVELINDEENPFNGGVEFIQAFPHPLLGHTSEKVIIKKEDIFKVIDFLNSIV